MSGRRRKALRASMIRTAQRLDRPDLLTPCIFRRVKRQWSGRGHASAVVGQARIGRAFQGRRGPVLEMKMGDAA